MQVHHINIVYIKKKKFLGFLRTEKYRVTHHAIHDIMYARWSVYIYKWLIQNIIYYILRLREITVRHRYIILYLCDARYRITMYIPGIPDTYQLRLYRINQNSKDNGCMCIIICINY